MPSLYILIPLFAIMLLNLPFRAMKRIAVWFAVALFLEQISLSIFHHPHILRNELSEMDRFFRMSFFVDHLSSIMFFCIGIVSLASLAVARYTMPDEQERFRFVNLLILSSIGMCGIVLAHDLFSLYVYLEITAVASFILIAFRKELTALEGAFKYIIVSVVATVLMLGSIALTLLVAPDTGFATLAEGMKQAHHSPVIIIAVALFICGLFIKGGLVPFHGWLPDAYTAAPAGVSVLLAGIVTKACGIYTLIRLVTAVFGFTDALRNVMMLVGAVSIVIGAFAALTQTDFKRLLAYSSISQVGYIVIGLGSGTPLGVAGAAFHLFNHSIFKSLLFVNAAAVERATGTTDIDRMGGVSARMPVTGTTSVIASLSAAGIPPLAGFWSKLMIIIALWQAGNTAYAVIAVLASVVTLGYLLTLQRKVFFGKLAAGLEEIAEPGAGIATAAVALAAISILAGICFPIVFKSYLMPLATVVMAQ